MLDYGDYQKGVCANLTSIRLAVSALMRLVLLFAAAGHERFLMRQLHVPFDSSKHQSETVVV